VSLVGAAIGDRIGQRLGRAGGTAAPEQIRHGILGEVTVPFDYDARPERYRLGMRVAGEYSAASL
jgi:hypothetical protein